MKAVLVAARNEIESELKAAKAVYNTFPKGANGLTPDSAKTEEWRAAKGRVDRLFRALQEVNAKIVKCK